MTTKTKLIIGFFALVAAVVIPLVFLVGRTHWRSSSEPVSSLDLVVPKDWPMFSPLKIHLRFVAWFREAYEKARASLPEGQRGDQDNHRHRRWLEVLGMSK